MYRSEGARSQPSGDCEATPVSTFSRPTGARNYTVSGPGAVNSPKASRSESWGLNGRVRAVLIFTGD